MNCTFDVIIPTHVLQFILITQIVEASLLYDGCMGFLSGKAAGAWC
jgi:hypothetical protein